MHAKHRLLIAYLVALHLLVGWMLWKSDFVERMSDEFSGPDDSEITPFFHQMLAYHERSVEIVPDGSVVFIGDSITQGLCVTAVAPNAVNYGIGGDTTVGVLRRLQSYRDVLSEASAVVLAVGINDLGWRHDHELVANYERILGELSNDRVFVSSIMPVDDTVRQDMDGFRKRIEDVNSSLRKLAETRPNVAFIDNSTALDRDADGRLDRALHVGDGLHLNSEGNAIWASTLRRVIAAEPRE